MNRLTEKDEQGNWYLKGIPWRYLYLGEVITPTLYDRLYGALYKLMKYEDTGLSPEQIEEMDGLYHEKCKEVAELQRKHRWTPVEERLPETDDMVLIQVSGHPTEYTTLYDALQLAEYNPDDGWILDEYPEWRGAAPVAWMPLPELYKAEE